jgi:hypothetical protein
VTEISFSEAEIVSAHIDTRSREVQFFDPDGADLPTSTLNFDELENI